MTKRMSGERLAEVHRLAKEGRSYGPLIVIELCEALVAERAALETARGAALEVAEPMCLIWSHRAAAAEAEVARLKGEREDALRAYNSLDAIVEHLGIADSDDTPVDAVQRIERQRDDAEARAKQMEEALLVPEVWSNEERDGMSEAFKRASAKHGHYETLFAVGAWLLRHRAALTEGKKT